MSFFIEKYATHLGVKPRLPHLSDHFYPVEFEKHITIDPSLGFYYQPNQGNVPRP